MYIRPTGIRSFFISINGTTINHMFLYSVLYWNHSFVNNTDLTWRLVWLHFSLRLSFGTPVYHNIMLFRPSNVWKTTRCFNSLSWRTARVSVRTRKFHLRGIFYHGFYAFGWSSSWWPASAPFLGNLCHSVGMTHRQKQYSRIGLAMVAYGAIPSRLPATYRWSEPGKLHFGRLPRVCHVWRIYSRF